MSILSHNQSQAVCFNPHFKGISGSDNRQVKPEMALGASLSTLSRAYPGDLNPSCISPVKETISNLPWTKIFKTGMIFNGIVIGAALILPRQHPRELNPLRFSPIKEAVGNLPWKRIFKIGIILTGVVIGAAFIDDLVKMIFKKNIPVNNHSDVTKPAIQQVLDQGIIKERNPCLIKMEPYYLDIDGDCTKEEMEKGRGDYKIFMENYEKQIKQETEKEVEEELKKFDARVAPILKRMEAHEMLRKESERRKINPTPEEKEEDERDTIRAAVKDSPFMEPYFRAKYPQYFDALPTETPTCNEVCQQEARNIFQVSNTASCSEIKKHYHALSLKSHPDKNPDLDKNIFLVISQAYKKLCP